MRTRSRMVVLCLAFGVLCFFAGCAGTGGGPRAGQDEAVRPGWSVPFDGSRSRPVVHDGVMYIGSFDGAVYAFDVTTGQQKWRYQTGEGLTSGPEITIVDSKRPEDQLAAALNAAEKKQPGKREVDATPVVSNGVVYIGSRDHCFYALDATSGKVKWRTELGHPVGGEAVVSGEVLVVLGHGVGSGLTPNVLFVLDSRDGRIKWSTDGTESASSPAVQESVAYFASEAKLVYYSWDDKEKRLFSLNAVDLGTGQPHWKIQLDGQRPNSPVLSMGTLYVTAFEEGGLESGPTGVRVYAVDPHTGEVLWDFEGGDVQAWQAPQLEVGPRQLFLVTVEGLSAVRKSSGELGWFLEGRYSPWSIQLRDSLYLSTGSRAKKQSILAIDPDTGTITWRVRSAGYLRCVTDDAVYVTEDTSLLALRRSDGKRLWKFNTGGFFREGTQLSAPPTRFGQQLIFPTTTNLIWGMDSIQGHLYSIDAETGKLK